MAISIKDIVNVTVQVDQGIATVSDFNVGLILGSSAVLNANTRTATYTSLAAMSSAGFGTDSPEYKAASLYFAQSPSPAKVVIGFQNKTGSETLVQAITACRKSDNTWFGAMSTGAYTTQELQNLAIYLESVEVPAYFIFQDKDANDLVTDGSAVSNIFKTLKTAGYKNMLGFYYTEANDANGYEVSAAVLGRICGLASGDSNSAFDLAYKSLVGVKSENITSVQLQNLKGYCGNAYANYGNKYDFITSSLMSSGYHFDEYYAIQLIRSYIEQNVVNALINNRVIHMTDDGVAVITNQIAYSFEQIKNMGYIASGIWNAAPVRTLATGDALPNGYIIFTDSVDTLSASERAQRITPPIVCCVKLAGAIEYISISVFVNR